MLQHIRQTSILNKIFNVNVNEWPKIGLAWTINFFYRIGFVLGWTVIVAMFVSRYGIASLPLLFILNAGFAVIGSVLYSSILEKFGKEQIMIATIFAAGGLLFGAMKILPYSEVFFFALVIVAISVFLAQFKINFISYVEEMFNPLQSARTFPLIEASETIGGIGAGLVITLFSAGLPIVSLIYLWIALLFFIVPLLLFHGVPIKEEHLSNDKKIGFVSKLKEAFSKAHERSYIKGLFYIVFLQWILFNLLEFQYTSAVFDNLSHVVRDTGSGFEHALFHDLGTLSVLFSCSALLIQLFLGSRLIGSLGIFGSMLLHPIVTLLSMIGLTGKFTFLTAILAKNNFTITTVVHTNAYHSAYYAVDEKARSYVRELLEGIVRPVGAIIGTLILIILEK
ncbi:hypothetical protein HYW82_03345, partial [Candidatus Peregrinibacteria bacterium]|nr:hypothetical protein [Candidatus Peregrinibacteria bacterium]